MREPIADYCFILAGIAFQWFSIFDCMDGMRARRTKTGSALGRIIDEAIDQLSYACVGCFIGYLLRVEAGILLFSFGLINVPFYSMEIRHFYCKDILMIVGELGPVEIELIYSVIFILSGTVFGVENASYDTSLMDITGIEVLTVIKIKYFIAILTIFLEILFSWENLKDSMNINPK